MICCLKTVSCSSWHGNEWRKYQNEKKFGARKSEQRGGKQQQQQQQTGKLATLHHLGAVLRQNRGLPESKVGVGGPISIRCVDEEVEEVDQHGGGLGGGDGGVVTLQRGLPLRLLHHPRPRATTSWSGRSQILCRVLSDSLHWQALWLFAIKITTMLLCNCDPWADLICHARYTNFTLNNDYHHNLHNEQHVCGRYCGRRRERGWRLSDPLVPLCGWLGWHWAGGVARSAALAVAARRDRLAGERGCRATLGLLPLTCVLRAVHHRASLSFYPTLLRLVGDGSYGGGSGGVGGGRSSCQHQAQHPTIFYSTLFPVYWLAVVGAAKTQW